MQHLRRAANELGRTIVGVNPVELSGVSIGDSVAIGGNCAAVLELNMVIGAETEDVALHVWAVVWLAEWLDVGTRCAESAQDWELAVADVARELIKVIDGFRGPWMSTDLFEDDLDFVAELTNTARVAGPSVSAAVFLPTSLSTAR